MYHLVEYILHIELARPSSVLYFFLFVFLVLFICPYHTIRPRELLAVDE